MQRVDVLGDSENVAVLRSSWQEREMRCTRLFVPERRS
jgi:hypothetical protein